MKRIDKFHKMNAEELANEIFHFHEKPKCRYCNYDDTVRCQPKYSYEPCCKEGIKAWLESEVDENT